MSSSTLKTILYSLLGIWLVYTLFFSSGSESSSEDVQYEEVVLPTQGLATIVQEVDSALFKIADEKTLPDTAQSLIIANYLDNTTDTFTLAEARLMQQAGYQGRGGSVVRAASFGLFGYMIGRNMMGYRPSSSAYVDQKTHQRVSNNAGNSMRQTANRTTRVRPGGKSGFGSGKSTRSYGG